MLASKVERAPDDPGRVGPGEEWEVRLWCARFNVTPDDLRAGSSTAEEEQRLRDAGRAAFSMGGED